MGWAGFHRLKTGGVFAPALRIRHPNTPHSTRQCRARGINHPARFPQPPSRTTVGDDRRTGAYDRSTRTTPHTRVHTVRSSGSLFGRAPTPVPLKNNSVWLPPDGEAHQHRVPQYCAIQYAQMLRENHPQECSPRASFPASNGRSLRV